VRTAYWWFAQDLVNAFDPAFDRRGKEATRRAARWLIGIGIFVTLFGAIGISEEAGAQYELQPATVTGRYLTYVGTRTSSSQIEHVRLRLEDGTEKSVTIASLYEAVDGRSGDSAEVDIRPDTNSIRAVVFEGRRYGTGNQVAAIVFTILTTLVGAFVLLRGIGRRRRWGFQQRRAAASEPGLPGLGGEG
jgi:hypothetical protein